MFDHNYNLTIATPNPFLRSWCHWKGIGGRNKNKIIILGAKTQGVKHAVTDSNQAKT